MRRFLYSSIPAKLRLREISGTTKLKYGMKVGRFYEKCPESLQIPLKKILKPEIFMHGHICIGFTEDGKYFLTYTCNIRFQISDTSSCSYNYKLFWWQFDLWNPLKKVFEVELFGGEHISNEVHLMVCQESSSGYMVVHGSMINTDSQSNGKMCYVSVFPKYSTSCSQSEQCLHFKYELLPPHPPFITSISLNLPNVLLMNSGDMLFAILLNDNLFEGDFTKNSRGNSCYCELRSELSPCSSQNLDTGDIDIDSDSTDFISYIRQGFTMSNDTANEILPNSPFDCTATVIPCTITSLNGNTKWMNAFEHRCFRTSDKGCLEKSEHFVCQAQFDAENFMNTELQKSEEISKRFVSLKDYDMQLVEACQKTNEVIILINALVVLHNPMKNENQQQSMSTFNPIQSQRSMKFVLYTVRYVLSWNVKIGAVKVLKKFPLVEGPGNICKTRQFSPSFSQAVQLRKKWFVPSSKKTSVHVLSNHTVFTGQSLEFLFHPEYPLAVVL